MRLFRKLFPFCQPLGMDYVVTSAQALEGVVLIAAGQFSRGLKRSEGAPGFSENGRFYSRYLVEIGLAEIYFQIATRTQPLRFWSAIKNLGFILKEVPFAKRKAKAYLNKIIRVGKEMGANGFMQSHAVHNLGLLLGQP